MRKSDVKVLTKIRKRLMVKFIGEYTAKIDDKGRLVLPSAFKSIMSAEGEGQSAPDMKLVIKKDIYAD